ncbi:MAG: hypothetical protein AAF604_04890 [Acidobacteriota bacterium]
MNSRARNALFAIAVMAAGGALSAAAETLYDACDNGSGRALLRYGRLQRTDRAPDGRRAILKYNMNCQRDPWRESGTPPTTLLDRSDPRVAEAYRERFGRPAADTAWRFRCADERSQLIRRAFEQRHGRPPDARETEDLIATCGAGFDWRAPRGGDCPDGWECDPNLRPCDGQPGCLEVDEILARCRRNNRTFEDPDFAGCRRDFVRWRCNVTPACLPTATEDPAEPAPPSAPPQPDPPQPDPPQSDPPQQAPPAEPTPDPSPAAPQVLVQHGGPWTASQGNSAIRFPLAVPANRDALEVDLTVTVPDQLPGRFAGVIALRAPHPNRPNREITLWQLQINGTNGKDRAWLNLGAPLGESEGEQWRGKRRRWRPGSEHRLRFRWDFASGALAYRDLDADEVAPAGMETPLRITEGLVLVVGQAKASKDGTHVPPFGYTYRDFVVRVH